MTSSRREHGPAFRVDPVLLVLGLLLLGVGLLILYSADHSAGGADRPAFDRQLVWAAIGLCAFLVGSVLPLKTWDVLAWPAYLGVLLLLGVVLVAGTGAHRWLRFGPVGIQPSELAKLAVILALARYLATRSGPPQSFRDLVGPGIVVLVPSLLVLRQPDLGTALTFAVVAFPMLFFAGAPLSLLFLAAAPVIAVLAAGTVWTFGAFAVILILVVLLSDVKTGDAVLSVLGSLAAGIATPILWRGLEPYQQDRILSFLDPGRDPLGAGYQIIQSKVAIGSGGLLGQGFLQGTQKNLSFLPEQRTDFVFSVWGEEFGFVGTAVVLGVFLALLVQGLVVARSARHRGAGLVAAGVTSLLAFHIFVNVGMTMGLVPVTGLPLPFLSYGGSFLVVAFAGLGLLSGVSVHRLEY